MFYRDPNSNLCYFPIQKNASTTFQTFFQSNGWQVVDKETAVKCQLFSHIQDPWTRYVKGMTELAYNQNERSFNSVKTTFWKDVILDPHITPIVSLTHGFTELIDFIPIDLDISSTDLTNDYLAEHKCNLRITKKDNRYVSTSKKLVYKKQVEKFLIERNLKRVLPLLEEDINLYTFWHDSYMSLNCILTSA